MVFGGAALRWEQHSEFTTYTWELPSPGVVPFVPDAARTILARLGDPSDAPTWGLLEPGRELVAGPPPLPRKQYDAA